MKQTVKTFVFWAVTLLFWELTLHLTIHHFVSSSFLLIILFTLPFAALLSALSNLFPRGNVILQYIYLTLLFLLFAVQLVYYQIFGTLLSLGYVSMGGQAVTGFLPTALTGIARSLPQLLLLALPFPVLALLHRYGVLESCRRPLPLQAALLGSFALSFLLALGSTGLFTSISPSPRLLYHDLTATLDRQTAYFGLLTAERLELRRLNQQGVQLSSGTADLTVSDKDTHSTDPLQLDRNIMPELDFEKLNTFTEDEGLLTLNRYFSSLSGTSKNAYTGLFEGYNLIQICAEAFSPYLINPELTPTLYRLSTEGIIFKNFYNSFPSLTTNGEYSLCMGLMPDLSRLSFATSIDNYVPFCLGNRFRSIGVSPLAYHNNIGTFYNRISTHTNMGYDFKGINFGLDMERLTPSSDLVMLEKTVDAYIDQEPFMVHYMTYSGHAEYDFVNNSMSIKNRERVAELNCSEALRAYYACQLELEDALTYLLQRLEEAGIADRTVIVLTSDHYPYGMPDDSYQEMAGEAVKDPFWRYRNSFICWNGGLESPIVVEDYCCTQDVLPTILNLFNIPYDSRLLTGTDILSDSAHVALLQDGSFLTESMVYDSTSGEITWLQPKENYADDYADQLIQATKNVFTVSSAILRTDYYDFAFSSLGLATEGPPKKQYTSYIDTAGTWYEEAVETLTGRGALKGTTSGNFNGGQTATRATFLAMLTRALYLEVPQESAPFTDLLESDWYYNTFASAWAAGLLKDETTCRPMEALTPVDALDLFSAAAEYAGVPDAGQWASRVFTHLLIEANQNSENTDLISRGAAAALLAPLVEVMD